VDLRVSMKKVGFGVKKKNHSPWFLWMNHRKGEGNQTEKAICHVTPFTGNVYRAQFVHTESRWL
jgi:hypothetical protein